MSVQVTGWTDTDIGRRHPSPCHHYVYRTMDCTTMAAYQPCNDFYCSPLLFFCISGTHHWYHDMRLLYPKEEENMPQPPLSNARLLVQLLERFQLACDTCVDLWM